MLVKLRWIGCGGYEIVTDEGLVITVDPWYTQHEFSSVPLDELRKPDVICVTHGHGDHYADVPELLKKTGAKLIATKPVCKHTEEKEGIPSSQLIPVEPDQEVEYKGVKFYVTSGYHIPLEKIPEVFMGEKITGKIPSIQELLDVLVKKIPSSKDFMKLKEAPNGSIVIGFHITTENGFTIWHTGSLLPSPKVEEYAKKLHPLIAIIQVLPTYEKDMAKVTQTINPCLCFPHHHDRLWKDQLTDTNLNLYFEELKKLAPKIKYMNPTLGKTYQVDLMVKEE